MGVGVQDTPAEAHRAVCTTRNVVSDMFSHVDLRVPEEGQNWGRGPTMCAKALRWVGMAHVFYRRPQYEPGVVVHGCNPSTWEAAAQIQGQFGLQFQDSLTVSTTPLPPTPAPATHTHKDPII